MSLWSEELLNAVEKLTLPFQTLDERGHGWVRRLAQIKLLESFNFIFIDGRLHDTNPFYFLPLPHLSLYQGHVLGASVCSIMSLLAHPSRQGWPPLM